VFSHNTGRKANVWHGRILHPWHNERDRYSIREGDSACDRGGFLTRTPQSTCPSHHACEGNRFDVFRSVQQNPLADRDNTEEAYGIRTRLHRRSVAGSHRQAALTDVLPTREKEWEVLSYVIQRLYVESLCPSLNTLSIRLFTVLANSRYRSSSSCSLWNHFLGK